MKSDHLIRHFQSVPTTKMFRKLRTISKPHLLEIYSFFSQNPKSVNEEGAKKLLIVAENYRDLIFYIEEYGHSDNPYPANSRATSISENAPHIQSQEFDDVESLHPYLLNSYLPLIDHRHYFFIVKYLLISPINLIKSAFELVVLGSDVNEILPLGVGSVRNFDVTVRATADFEESQFGS